MFFQVWSTHCDDILALSQEIWGCRFGIKETIQVT